MAGDLFGIQERRVRRTMRMLDRICRAHSAAWFDGIQSHILRAKWTPALSMLAKYIYEQEQIWEEPQYADLLAYLEDTEPGDRSALSVALTLFPNSDFPATDAVIIDDNRIRQSVVNVYNSCKAHLAWWQTEMAEFMNEGGIPRIALQELVSYILAFDVALEHHQKDQILSCIQLIAKDDLHLRMRAAELPPRA